MPSISVPVHSYKLRSPPASSARLVNCFVEALPQGAKTPVLLTRCPGVDPFVTVGTGPIRGKYRAFGTMFVVSGVELYEVAEDGTATLLGAVGSGPISMAHNAVSLVVVSAPNAYYYTDSTATFAQITDSDFTALGARWVAFIDNYIVFVSFDGTRFFWSAVGDETDYDALDYAIPEGSPDDIVGMIANQRQLVLLGSESLEFWNTTDAGFERAINGFVEKGCFNGDTVSRLDAGFAFVADDYTVRMMNGTQPVRISTYAIEQFLSSVDITTGRAYSYSQDGHIFYVLSFSTGCKVFDLTSGEWHDRQSWPEDYYRWQFHCSAYGRQYVGDAYSNKIGIFDAETYSEYGDVQRMEWTYQPIYAENRMAVHRRLEIVMETGVGLTTGQGSSPQVMLAYSNDGGMTYENLPNRSIGQIGERLTRPHWDGLGGARQRVYRAAISDPVKVVVTDTILTAEGARQ